MHIETLYQMKINCFSLGSQRLQRVITWSRDMYSSLYVHNTDNERGVSPYRKLTGFCPQIDFHNIMYNDCLTYDYSICDIVSHLPIYMVKK